MPMLVKCYGQPSEEWFPGVAFCGSDCPDDRDALVTELGLELTPARRLLIAVPPTSPWASVKSLLRAGYAVQLDNGLPIQED